MSIAKPTPAQYAWHEGERMMFVCLDPATWQGREYDDHSTPLEAIDPARLDTDQWCRAALSWGARTVLFVAKHTGGFCWWRTETSTYGIKETPWKGGRGDVLSDLAASCRAHDLQLAVYVYPGDDTWGAGIGSGGRTSDPQKQDAYNGVYRQQLTEVLTCYGPIVEVWFDGSCVIPVGDLLEKHAPDAMVFQGPHATIRWVGNEKGEIPYPSWNAVSSQDLRSGVSTALHSTPDGDAWAPLECDTTLYDHYWFWSPEKTRARKSLDTLVECYYKSVGRGGVLLLNSTPDTSGLIPEQDMELYADFGREIDRRFAKPVAETHGTGMVVELHLGRTETINHIVTMEDYRHGERIRSYVLEGYAGGQWYELAKGSAVGRKRVDVFASVQVSAVRLRVAEAVAPPLIRSLAAFNVTGVDIPKLMAQLATGQE